MPQITLRPGGANASVPGPGNPNPPKRTEITGWSSGAARRNRQFLQSIDLQAIRPETDLGFFCTLTVRDCPPSAEDWARLVNSWLKRMTRLGMVRYHWVIEMQARGVPHLHAVLYWDRLDLRARIRDGMDWDGQLEPLYAWLDLAEPYGAQERAQRVEKCDDRVELLRYVAKHSARTAEHYQRRPGDMPEGWRKTGRLWGASRAPSWPTSTFRFEVDERTFWRYRRLIRGYRVAEARKRLATARHHGKADLVSERRTLASSRRCLRSNRKSHSRVKPSSLWIPEGVSWAFLEHLRQEPAADIYLIERTG